MRNLGYLVVCSLSLLLLFSGCSDDDGEGGGGNGVSTGRYLISGYFGMLAVEGNLEVQVLRLQSSDPPATDCQIDVNGIQLTLVPVISYEDYAVFATAAVEYSPLTDYTITASLSGMTSTCSFTTPSLEEIDITSPENYSEFTPGEDITLTWSFHGGPPEQIDITVESTDADDNLYEETIDGDLTTYTIPGSSTAGWGIYSQVDISVMPHEYCYSFSGNLASPASGVFVAPLGDYISLMPSDTGGVGPSDTTWYVYIWLSDYILDADGSSTTFATAQVQSEYGGPCPDGTEVTFSCQPTGMVSFDPVVATTTGGIATTTITAGTTPGDVNIVATAMGSSDFDVLNLREITEITITIGDGAYPTISWTPDDVVFNGLIVRETGISIGNLRWAIVGGIGGFGTPVVYGTVPTGATQTWPLDDATPDSLKIDTEYLFGFIDSSGDTAFHYFTRTAM